MVNWLMTVANWLTEAAAAADWNKAKATWAVRAAGLGEEAAEAAANREVKPSAS